MAREDLIPLNKRTKEEQKKIATAGGRASGAARRRKRTLKEAAEIYLSLPVSDKRELNRILKTGLDAEEIDNQMAIIVGLGQTAASGNSKAAKVLFDLLGNETSADKEGENNLLQAIVDNTQEDIDTNDIPEIEQTPIAGDDLVEPSGV